MDDDRSEFQRLGDAMGREAFVAWLESLSPQNRVRLLYDWEFRARRKQKPPEGSWRVWHLRAGRGFGKTLTGAEWVRWRVEREGAKRIALVAPTAADARDVMVEGPSGIKAVCPPWNPAEYEPSKKRVTWPKYGAVATLFSAEEPNRLRGPQHDTAWCDELAAWQRLGETWEMLDFNTRAGDPRTLITSTPRGLKLLRTIEADPHTVTVTGTTYENSDNLAPSFIDKIKTKYDGTRLGQQEVHAQILDDNPGALWKRSNIDQARMSTEHAPREFRSIVVALDPSTTSTSSSCEAGIVVCASAMCSCMGSPELHGFVIHDDTDTYTPAETCEHVIRMFRRFGADCVVGEKNQGGDWIESLLRTYPDGRSIPYYGVHARVGKQLRAEPVASLYEQGKVHHVGMLAKLEDEMCDWDPAKSTDSPDRIDALVHGLTRLLIRQDRTADIEVSFAF